MNIWSRSKSSKSQYEDSSGSKRKLIRGENNPMTVLNGGKREEVDDLDSRKTQTAASSNELPPPVVAGSPSRKKVKKTARIERSLHDYWAMFMKRIGSGTDPGDSDSMPDTGGESTEDSHWKTTQSQAQISPEQWKTDPRSINQTLRPGSPQEEEDSDFCDEIVVDRVWGSQQENEKSSESPSDHAAGSPEKSGTSHPHDMGTDGDSLLVPATGIWTPFMILRYRFYPAMVEFFTSKFHDSHTEDHYRKEIWFTTKPLAVWSALFYVLNWILGCALVPKPFELADKIFYFGVAIAFTIPVPFMVMYDWPRDRPVAYQIFLTFSTWIWSVYQLLFIFLCGFYSHDIHFSCGQKDFLATFYYTTALQTIALFGLKQNRLPAMMGAIVFLALMIALVVPFRVSWIRNVLNFIAFQAFLLYIHYMREIAERRLYTLRDQLKVQYKATQKAQLNERKEADSKRRLTSYVFHDKPDITVFCASAQVRVPLNTALIAVQNMDAYGVIRKDDDAALEFSALQGSLSMMSKVLNDVLDFNRLDSGRFEFSYRPYSLHQAMRSMFVPLKLATNARGLELVIHLDPKIDEIARRALYEARGYDQTTVDKLLKDLPNDDGIVVGDEMRLRQVVTNLASNACKFTPAGGKLNISTKLVIPEGPLRVQTHDENKFSDQDTKQTSSHDGLSANSLNKHNLNALDFVSPLDRLIFRIEVTDTGVGIRKRDISRGRLFSAFNQTEQGRQQGGKGTGLGLALTRHIVKLSGGRLGVRSQVGKGSTFWVELPVGIGKKAIAESMGGSTSAKSEGKPPSSSAGTSVQGNYQSTLNHEDTTRFEGAYNTINHRSGRPVSVPLAEKDRSSSYLSSASSQAPSALQSIMEQGGLVEIAANRHSDKDPVPTRTIGDPSTGTDSPQEFLSTVNGDQSIPHNRHVKRSRPTHVDLPGPPNFSFNLNGSILGNDIQTNFENHSPRTPTSSVVDDPIRVLVVDDDPLTRKLMQRMLLRLGCRVSTAGNGLIALDLITGDGATPHSEDSPPLSKDTGKDLEVSIEGPRYEIIFLDNQMPVLSGLDTVAKLRASGRHDLLVVGVTGNALLSDQQEYLDAGADHVITKPVREPEIKHMLNVANGRRKQHPSETTPS